MTTDPDLVTQSQYLENTLSTGNLSEYCNYKIEIAANTAQAEVWKFIAATFHSDKSGKFLELLGFDPDAHQLGNRRLVPGRRHAQPRCQPGRWRLHRYVQRHRRLPVRLFGFLRPEGRRKGCGNTRERWGIDHCDRCPFVCLRQKCQVPAVGQS